MKPTPAPPPGLLTVEQVAERLAVDVTWVRRQIDRRTLRHVKLGHYVRIDPADLAALIAAGVREPVSR